MILSAPASPVQPEDFNADILFLIDSSSPVSKDDFQRQTKFVSLIAKYLNVAPSRAALMVYAGDPVLSIRLVFIFLKYLEFHGEYTPGNVLGGR